MKKGSRKENHSYSKFTKAESRDSVITMTEAREKLTGFPTAESFKKL